MQDKIVVQCTSDSFCSAEVAQDERVYIKYEPKDNKPMWSIYSADGEKMAEALSRKTALAIVQQNELQATQVN